MEQHLRDHHPRLECPFGQMLALHSGAPHLIPTRRHGDESPQVPRALARAVPPLGCSATLFVAWFHAQMCVSTLCAGVRPANLETGGLPTDYSRVLTCADTVILFSLVYIHTSYIYDEEPVSMGRASAVTPVPLRFVSSCATRSSANTATSGAVRCASTALYTRPCMNITSICSSLSLHSAAVIMWRVPCEVCHNRRDAPSSPHPYRQERTRVHSSAFSAL